MSDLEKPTAEQNQATENERAHLQAERRKLRPFRVFFYTLYLIFTAVFVTLIARSIWVDLFAKDPVTQLRVEHPEVESCVDELERLFKKLSTRSAFPAATSEPGDWERFSREFEDRLDEFQRKCVNEPASESEIVVRSAIARTANQLENWRQHLSRCGEEGEKERAALVRSIADLREAAKRTP